MNWELFLKEFFTFSYLPLILESGKCACMVAYMEVSKQEVG